MASRDSERTLKTRFTLRLYPRAFCRSICQKLCEKWATFHFSFFSLFRCLALSYLFPLSLFSSLLTLRSPIRPFPPPFPPPRLLFTQDQPPFVFLTVVTFHNAPPPIPPPHSSASKKDLDFSWNISRYLNLTFFCLRPDLFSRSLGHPDEWLCPSSPSCLDLRPSFLHPLRYFWLSVDILFLHVQSFVDICPCTSTFSLASNVFPRSSTF